MIEFFFRPKERIFLNFGRRCLRTTKISKKIVPRMYLLTDARYLHKAANLVDNAFGDRQTWESSQDRDC